MNDDGDFLQQLATGSSLGGGESRNDGYVGTKALMLAVLEEAVRTYFGPPGYKRREAEDWVRSKRSSAFSFVTICETLGLDPDAVRQALPRLKPDFVRPLSRIKNSRLNDPRKLTPTR